MALKLKHSSVITTSQGQIMWIVIHAQLPCELHYRLSVQGPMANLAIHLLDKLTCFTFLSAASVNFNKCCSRYVHRMKWYNCAKRTRLTYIHPRSKLCLHNLLCLRWLSWHISTSENHKKSKPPRHVLRNRDIDNHLITSICDLKNLSNLICIIAHKRISDE